MIRNSYTEILYYLLIPLAIALAVFGIFLLVSSKKKGTKEHTYRVNFWSSFLGVFFGALLFSIALAFSVVFIRRIYELGLVGTYKIVLGVLYVFPIIPLAFLVYFIYHFFYVINHRNDQIVEELSLEEE